MAKKILATEDIALTATRDRAVPYNSVDAAFLLARKGRPIPPEFTDLVTRKGAPKQAPKSATKEQKPAGNKSKKGD